MLCMMESEIPMDVAAARFTLRQLSCFVAACEHGGVGAAAERLRLAQATVSAALADLEHALGVRLLVRGGRRPAAPTPAGRALLADARAVLDAASVLARHAVGLADEVAGALPVGCLVTLAPVVAPACCRAFERRWPRAEVRLVTGDQEALLRGLADGSLALAITYDLRLDASVAFEPLAPAPPYALVAGDHPLARRARVRLAALAGEPLVLLDLPLSRDYFLGLFRTRRLEPNVVRRVADPELVRSLVARGYGYTLANASPAPTQAVDGAPLVAVPVQDALPAPRLGLARRGGLEQTRSARAFSDTCAELLGAADAAQPRARGAQGPRGRR
jgi:DNA-binding transcriptional LysR family regulator